MCIVFYSEKSSEETIGKLGEFFKSENEQNEGKFACHVNHLLFRTFNAY